MASKRGTRASARKSGRKSGRKSAAKPAKSPRRGSRTSAEGAATGARARGERGRGLASHVKRTARKVLFGSLGVAGYVADAARGRMRRTGANDGGTAVDPIPEGYRTVTPYLVVGDVPRLIEFLQQAFGATELGRVPRPDGSIMHAEVQIGDSRVMMGEPSDPAAVMPGCLRLYAVDTDALYHLALQAGATSLREPADQFYGDRTAGVRDPLGNQWWIATRVENVPPVEMALRAALGTGGSS